MMIVDSGADEEINDEVEVEVGDDIDVMFVVMVERYDVTYVVGHNEIETEITDLITVVASGGHTGTEGGQAATVTYCVESTVEVDIVGKMSTMITLVVKT